MTPKRWDIFCNIVDNFGDIGVCWRLSRQLANEHHMRVRLFINDFYIASKIIPNFDIQQPQQTIQHVEIMAWPTEKTSLPEVVIEGFSCQLPEIYMRQISEADKPPQKPVVWINLEYLSAEKWVENCHAMPSTHPTLGIRKTFFYPGFTEKTGGLLREQKLMQMRDAFCQSVALQRQFWHQLIPSYKQMDIEHAIKISLFSYPQADIKNLILMLVQCKKPVHIFLPLHAEMATLNGMVEEYHLQINTVKTIQKVSLHWLPFLSQREYDQLLWACDLNFVRGEDSWIRAIWAGKPFIWQPYIQEENTHIQKLNAFLTMYTKDASKEIASLIQEAHQIWSNAISAPATDFWCQLIVQLKHWQDFSMQKSDMLARQTHLSAQLVHFSQKLAGENLTKNTV